MLFVIEEQQLVRTIVELLPERFYVYSHDHLGSFPEASPSALDISAKIVYLDPPFPTTKLGSCRKPKASSIYITCV